MNPRRAIVVAAVALAAAAPSSPASAGDTAATVNGVDISVNDFEEALEETLEEQGAEQIVPGDAGRGVLQNLVVDEARRQFLEENPVPDSIREEYEETGVADGLLCLRFFIAEDIEAGEEAMEQLSEGAEFATVAAEFDPAQSSRTLTGDPTQACLPVDQLPEGSEAVQEALEEAGAGEPAGPVEIETEEVVLVVLAPPWDEVAGAFLDVEAFGEFLAEADISVNPRYGRWDPNRGVVPLGQE